MFDDEVAALSASSGLSAPLLRLLLCCVASNFLAIVYRLFIIQLSLPVKHVFSVVVGLTLTYFCYAEDTVHSVITVACTYFILLGFGSFSRDVATAVAWLFNLAYLLIGYYFVSTDSYDVDWTMAQCVLCLRMMGFAFDFRDGADPASEKHRDRSVNNLKNLPNILEVFSFAFHFSGFFVGPQYSFRFYERFLARTERKSGGGPRTIITLVGALLFMGLANAGGAFFPSTFTLTEEYAAYPFWRKVVYIWIFGKFAYYKYIGMWLLVDVGCIISGLGYNGEDAEGHTRWNAVINIDPWLFETTPYLTGVVDSFNINTNQWTKSYIYKRLAWLGNKHASGLGALTFLAIWHGWSPGYFLAFYFEFITVAAEKALARIAAPVANLLPGPLVFAAMWLMRTFIISYAFIVFDLLTLDKCMTAWGSLHYLPVIITMVILVLDAVIPQRKKDSKSKEH